MSLSIDWPAITADARLLSQLRSHVQSLLDEHVNSPLPVRDDGTRVHLLELSLGYCAPIVELNALGVDAAAALEAASSADHANNPAASLAALNLAPQHTRTPQPQQPWMHDASHSHNASPALSSSGSLSGSDVGSSASASQRVASIAADGCLARLSFQFCASPPSRSRDFPPVSHTPQSAVPSLRRSGMFSGSPAPPRSAAASPMPRSASSAHLAAQPCHCALSASSVQSLAASGVLPAAAAASTSVSAAPAPARVSVLLACNPLLHYKISSAVDGTNAGRKLDKAAEHGLALAMAQLVGEHRTFDLPDMPTLKQIKQKQ